MHRREEDTGGYYDRPGKDQKAMACIAVAFLLCVLLGLGAGAAEWVDRHTTLNLPF